VQRQREHRRIAREDGRRAVALVHVQVDHGHARRAGAGLAARVLGLHQARGHGHVVEHAITAAAAGAWRGACRRPGWRPRLRACATRAACDGGADRAARALDHRLAPRKADLALRARVQRAARHGVDVGRRVRQRQLAVRGRLGGPEVDAGQFGRARSRSRAYLPIGKRCPGGSGSTKRVE
jgi:hypothetical protein